MDWFSGVCNHGEARALNEVIRMCGVEDVPRVLRRQKLRCCGHDKREEGQVLKRSLGGRGGKGGNQLSKRDQKTVCGGNCKKDKHLGGEDTIQSVGESCRLSNTRRCSYGVATTVVIIWCWSEE